MKLRPEVVYTKIYQSRFQVMLLLLLPLGLADMSSQILVSLYHVKIGTSVV